MEVHRNNDTIICLLNIYNALCSDFSSLDLDQSCHMMLVSTGRISVSLCMVPTSHAEEKAFFISMQTPYAALVDSSEMRRITRRQNVNSDLDIGGKSAHLFGLFYNI